VASIACIVATHALLTTRGVPTPHRAGIPKVHRRLRPTQP